MQSRRPKPVKVGDKKSSNPRSTSAPRFKKESDKPEKKDTFSYLRKTNEKVDFERKSSDKKRDAGFTNSFGKKSKEVMGKASKLSNNYYLDKFGDKPKEKEKGKEKESDLSRSEYNRRNTENGRAKKSDFSRPVKSRDGRSGEKRDAHRPFTSGDRSVTTPKFIKTKKVQSEPSDESLGIRLNRYIANSGVCARREADKLIEAGEIYVNGKATTDFSYRVQPTDTVRYGSKVLKREKPVYILLNKPKNFLTTTDDPEGRRSVMELVKDASDARLYPVGRLDRNTTGLLLLTNDGDLADKLMHPSYESKKIYQVDLDRPFSDEDLRKVREGIKLEDGPIKADDVEIVSADRKSVGIEIHSGRNRIVRRIFEHLGYNIDRLDRVMYAGLTKKDLPRGTWRYLTELEVTTIKHMKR